MKDYGRVLNKWIQLEHPVDLGPGQHRTALRGAVLAISVDEAFAHTDVADPDMALACMAGMLLRLDFLEESHRISQSISGDTGSYWHGIMHRREPDYGNAAYWFNRAGAHPVFQEVDTATRRQQLGRYEPLAFIDEVKACYGKGGEEEDRCQAVQQIEWETLFDYCYAKAVNKLR